MKHFARREFLDLGIKSIIFIPVFNMLACSGRKSVLLSPLDSLKKLILILGPWPPEDKDLAEDFSRRFVRADPIIVQYLPESASLIQKLAAEFPDDTCSVDEIDLNDFSSEESNLITRLVNHLYNVNEVQFYLAGTPPWGQCLGDPDWHTKPPTAGNPS